MSEAAFDTLAVAQRLRNAGFEDSKAEAVTFAIRDGVTGGVATKADLDRLETELKTELKWVKLIGGAVLGVLVLPWLVKFLSAAMP